MPVEEPKPEPTVLTLDDTTPVIWTDGKASRCSWLGGSKGAAGQGSRRGDARAGCQAALGLLAVAVGLCLAPEGIVREKERKMHPSDVG